MIHHSKKHGDIEIGDMVEPHLVATIKKLRRERDLAQCGGALQNFTNGAVLKEMERVAAERGVVVE
jgi:ubiquinone/menaquinone biosynthesis C-methylase UbiE